MAKIQKKKNIQICSLTLLFVVCCFPNQTTIMPAVLRYLAGPGDMGKGGEDFGKNQSVALVGEKDDVLAHAEEGQILLIFF